MEGVLNLTCFYQTIDAFCDLNVLRNYQCWTLGLSGTLMQTSCLGYSACRNNSLEVWTMRVLHTYNLQNLLLCPCSAPPRIIFMQFPFVSHLGLYSCQCALPSYHLLSLSKVHLKSIFLAILLQGMNLNLWKFIGIMEHFKAFWVISE